MSLIDRSQFVKFGVPNGRTPEMTVTLTVGDQQETYKTPKGFQLDRFVAFRNRDKNLKVTYHEVPGRKVQGIEILVVDPKTEAIVERHVAVPDPGQGEK